MKLLKDICSERKRLIFSQIENNNANIKKKEEGGRIIFKYSSYINNDCCMIKM